MEEPISVDVEYEDWNATHDHMSKTLRVDGTCVVPGGGLALSLRPSEQQGANPMMLMFDLEVSATGESPSRQQLHYDQPWDDDGIQYKEVGFRVVGAQSEPPEQLRIQDVS